MRTMVSTSWPMRMTFLLILSAGCVDLNVEESKSETSGSKTQNSTSTANSVTGTIEQAGMELLRNPSTGEEAIIFKPFSTELSGGRIYRRAGSIQPPNEPVSLTEQEAIDYLANEVGLIVSAKEICNLVDNPGQPFPKTLRINDERAAVIAKLENLEWMELSRADVTDSSLAFFSGLKKLRYLNLNHNEEITDEGLRHLTGLNLIYLELDSCKGITNDGLGVLSKITSLRHLSLSRCDSITEDGFRHLETLTNLQELSVFSSNLNSFGLAHLKNLPNLKHLGISNGNKNLPFDELKQHLSEFKSLKRLFVQHSLTNEQNQELAKAFPNLSFR